LDEVRALRAAYGEGAVALRSLGYAQLCAHLRGECTQAQAVAAIIRATRRYARRQLTWFRSEPPGVWYACANELPVAEAGRFLHDERVDDQERGEPGAWRPR